MKCSACGVAKMPGDYLEMRSAYNPKDPDPQVCDHCRKYGPPLADPLRGLNVKERKALKVLAAGGSHRAASRASGIDDKTLRESLAGENKSSMRAAFSRLMVDQGLDPDSIITVLREGLSANKHQWNSKDKEFNEFPDFSSRLNAAKTAIKVHSLEPPKEAAGGAGTNAVQVVINTNVGSDQPIEKPGTYTIEVEASDG